MSGSGMSMIGMGKSDTVDRALESNMKNYASLY